LPIGARNAGLFVSRGQGTHPTRVIDSYELIFVRRGTLGMFEEQQRFAVRAGQTLLLRPGRRHGGTAPYPPDLSFYWIHFTLAAAGRRRPTLAVPQQAAIAHPDRLTELFRRFLDDQESGRATPLSAALLVALMLEATAGTSREGRAAPSDSAAALAARAEAWLLTRFQEPVSAADVAAGLSCNPDYLGRVFRRVHGITLTDAIHRHRLRHARRMLMDGAQNVDQVARACGFREAGYFRRLFRRTEGVTPLAFRRLYARMHVNTQ
jgi:AraC-like DNA-binding protein